MIAGAIELSDKSSELIHPETLRTDPDGVLRCRVKDRFPARFTRTGQAHLLLAIEPRATGLALRARDAWLHPGLADEAAQLADLADLG